jgi:hypothetical protein
MASVTFLEAVGGDGSTVTDDADPTTGLDGRGYVDRFVPALAQVVAVADFVVDTAVAADASADAAAASATSALGAPGTNATSTTSLTVGTGSKSLTIQTGKAYSVGQVVVIASTASPGNQMTGIITSYNSGTGALVVDAQQTLGSGTLAAWTISLGALVSSTLPSQTSNSGKFLTTNGTSASWGDALVPSGNLSGLSNYTTARSNMGLAIGTNVQAYDAGLQSIAGLTTAADRLIYTTASDTYAVATFTADARTLVGGANFAAMRTSLGLVIGTNVQAYNANLAALAGLTLAANKLPYATGSGAMALTDLSSFARTFLDDASAGDVRTTIGAAASGANNDITSITGLSTPLSVAQGGTGVTSLGVGAAGGSEYQVGPVYVKTGGATVTVGGSGTSGEATIDFTSLGLTDFPTGVTSVTLGIELTSGGPSSNSYVPYYRNASTTGVIIGADASGSGGATVTVSWTVTGY